MNTTEMKKLELLNLLENNKLFGVEYVNSPFFGEYKSMNSKLPFNLELLSEYTSRCSLCSLSKSKVSFNFGFGDNTSQIMMINLEQNNITELDKLKFLFDSEVEIDINHIYMTNILKCSTKNKKENLDDEIDQCLGYLEQQIRIIKPKIIITLGSAFNYLLNNSYDILDISGNLFKYNTSTVVPLLGLDFLNKNPSYNSNMINDLKKIKKLLEKK